MSEFSSYRLEVPPPQQIVLPRPDLSAREALRVVRPFVARFAQPWQLATIQGSYSISQEPGRSESWRFSFRHGDSSDVVHVDLFANDSLGRISFLPVTVPAIFLSSWPVPAPLPDSWLDSTDVAPVITLQPTPEGLSQLSPWIMMSFMPQNDAVFIWRVLRVAKDRGSNFAQWWLDVDASDARVISEKLDRRYGQHLITCRQRSGSDVWEDLPLPDWFKEGRKSAS